MVNQTLEQKDWIVVRIWQHELKDEKWHEKISNAFRKSEQIKWENRWWVGMPKSWMFALQNYSYQFV